MTVVPTPQPPNPFSSTVDKTRMRRRRVDPPLALLLLALGICFALFELTPLDFWLQDHFYDARSGHWWVDGNARLGRALFYVGPKFAIIALAVGLLALIVGPAAWRTRGQAAGWQTQRGTLAVALFAAGLVPALVGFLKAHSSVFCPSELERYGGCASYVRPFATLGQADDGTPRGHCWPAGHASGGFALVALAVLTRDPVKRRRIYLLGLGLGWTMGLYQMFKGAHFLSHTVITMLLALVIARIATLWVNWRMAGLPSHRL